MKYEFVKVDSDTTELRYKDKVFTFRKDIDLEKRIQESIPRARILLNAELAKMGLTKKDLVIERHEGNKTYYVLKVNRTEFVNYDSVKLEKSNINWNK